MDEATRKQLERGQRMMELLKQPQYSPLSVAEIAIVFYAVSEGYFDDVPVSEVVGFEQAMLRFLRQEKADTLKHIKY